MPSRNPKCGEYERRCSIFLRFNRSPRRSRLISLATFIGIYAAKRGPPSEANGPSERGNRGINAPAPVGPAATVKFRRSSSCFIFSEHRVSPRRSSLVSHNSAGRKKRRRSVRVASRERRRTTRRGRGRGGESCEHSGMGRGWQCSHILFAKRNVAGGGSESVAYRFLLLMNSS